jgi:hypothetical protein
MHRVVLVLAGIGTFVEAFGFGFGLYLLGTVIDQYHMSMGGRPYSEGRTVVWILAAILFVCFLVLTALLAVAAVRGRPLNRTGRGLTVGALILHGLIGLALLLNGSAAALVGVGAVFCLLLLGLVLQPAPHASATPTPSSA